ncbi:hypothetical protein HOY80DRAFT_1008077 [Tuber brumale]|nr:hypothetical protein HOY80DRAFT_1008077 [Tuber brumale]
MAYWQLLPRIHSCPSHALRKTSLETLLPLSSIFQPSSPIQPSPNKNSPQTTLLHSSLTIARISLRSNSPSYPGHYYSRAFIFGNCYLLQQLISLAPYTPPPQPPTVPWVALLKLYQRHLPPPPSPGIAQHVFRRHL